MVIIGYKDKITGHATCCRSLRLASILRLALCCIFAAIALPVVAQTTNELLTNAVDVISLPAEKAAHYLKVSVTGVVTASDPALKGRFFLQDATGGVFVDNANGPHLEPGELVKVTGITYPGAYAPTVTGPRVQVVGQEPLPPAKPVSVEQLMSGTEDSQRVEISGVVRDAREDGNRLAIDLAAGGYRFRAFVTAPPDYPFEKLIGSQVRIRGTAAEAHNRSLRQLIVVEVYIPVWADLVVEQREAVNPFDKPVIPLNNLAQYRRDNSLGQRVHVRGVVTFQENGRSLFLQDEQGGLQIQSRQNTVCAPGEVVEAVGFPSFENYLPVLQDAIFQKVPVPSLAVKPKAVTVAELQGGLHHAEYVSLTGKLIERTVHPGSASKFSKPDTTILVLQGSNFTFTAEADYAPDQSGLGAIPIGSVLRVSGVCLTEIDSDGKLKSFEILVGSPGDIRILKKPSWLTPRRLLIGLLILGSVLIVVAGWTVILSRKNTTLNYLIGEREKAQQELQQAHDQLEERVKERTEQLKFEITARKESEVQFKAVLTERTRLAQELHDTVEQTLTGIALQLDTASKLHGRNSENSLHHLELARSLMAKSQVEVRQSIWDLRSRALEQFDLARALAEGARQITSGTDIQVQFETGGEPRPLPEVLEENLLRIGQEALANAIKHSQATRVNMELHFERGQISLQVRDNGIGFNQAEAVGPSEGHFGLLGMTERAGRLGGKLVLESKPGEGTVVRVEIPLLPSLESQPAAAVDGMAMI
jgi:signal transduction histidine kinase